MSQGVYEIRKYAVSGPGQEPKTRGVRHGTPSDAASLGVTLGGIARHFERLGLETRYTPQHSVYVKRRSGAWTLYVIVADGPSYRHLPQFRIGAR